MNARLRLTADLDYDADLMHGGFGDLEALESFLNTVLDGPLALHSADGEVGTLRLVRIHPSIQIESAED